MIEIDVRGPYSSEVVEVAMRGEVLFSETGHLTVTMHSHYLVELLPCHPIAFLCITRYPFDSSAGSKYSSELPLSCTDMLDDR
jgi:hypothetical protein